MREDANREGVVEAALRLALAEKLDIDPRELDGLEAEAAAAALSHFVERAPGQEQLPAWLGDESLDEQRNDLIAEGVRAALAYELRIAPERLARINVVGAAHALDRIRSRRVAEESAESAVARDAILEDDRELVRHILNDALAEHLDVPAAAVASLDTDLASHILARLIDLRRQLDERTEKPEPAFVDRRDAVARIVRDAVAQDIAVHPRLLGSLDPTAAALLLGRFAQARRTVEVLKSNVASDELTEALRRSAGEAELEREIRRVRRTGNGQLVVAFVDVDSLKTVNDTRGHAAGDDLLRQLVATLKNRLRAYDTVARWGGDEFLVILPQTDLEDAGSIMGEVRRLFAERTEERFSYGLAALEDEEEGAELVRRADHRLYDAKRSRGSGGGEEADEAEDMEPLPAEPATEAAEGPGEATAEVRPDAFTAPAEPPAERRSWLRRLLG